MQDLVESATVPCDLCGSDRWRPLLKAREFLLGTGDVFQIVRCSGCRHCYTHPIPRREILERFNTTQATVAALRSTPTDALQIGGVPWKTVMARRAELLSKYASPGVVLDVGCGDGLFLEHLRQEGWTVEGVEPLGPSLEYARSVLGLTVHEGRVERRPSGTGTTMP